MLLGQLIKSIEYSNDVPVSGDFKVRGISCNSRDVGKDFVFVAIKGNRQDGNKFIADALRKGAGAVVTSSSTRLSCRVKVPFIKVKDTRKALAMLVTEFYGNPSEKIRVVGVTGTNGKTTIAYLIEFLIKEAGSSAGVIGTINYRFREKIMPSKNTTPGAADLQAMLAEMRKEGVKYAVMEVSSHALDQDRTLGINFSSAIFTNLTQDHLDYHKTLHKYFLAKAKLFRNLKPGAFAALNNDDKYSRQLKKITKARVITYGIENDSDVMAKDITYSVNCTEFLLKAPGVRLKLKIQLIGRHNIYNVLSAIAWAIKEGIDIKVIKNAVEKFSLVPGRLERVEFGGDFSVFVDYAHTEDALKNIIQALRHLARKRIIVVFGCGGERDRGKRPKMGKVVTELADYAIITSDNPRSEDPLDIIREVKKGIRRDNYCVIPERREAIERSLSLAEAGDIVLLAGKGHENYQILKDRTVHFDDKEIADRCLRSKKF